MLGIAIRPESPADSAEIEAVTVTAFATAPHTAHTEQLTQESGHQRSPGSAKSRRSD